MKRFGGWIMILASLSLLVYIIWMFSTWEQLQSWPMALAAGFASSTILMFSINVLKRNPRKKKAK